LLQKGADLNHVDREGRTALIAASHTGCVKTVEVLLDHEASVNHADSDGRTALAVCIMSESLNNHFGKNFSTPCKIMVVQICFKISFKCYIFFQNS
jgi:hypothetical protein